MPHESTVAHEQRLVIENPQFLRSRQDSLTHNSDVIDAIAERNKPTVIYFFHNCIELR